MCVNVEEEEVLLLFNAICVHSGYHPLDIRQFSKILLYIISRIWIVDEVFNSVLAILYLVEIEQGFEDPLFHESFAKFC